MSLQISKSHARLAISRCKVVLTINYTGCALTSSPAVSACLGGPLGGTAEQLVQPDAFVSTTGTNITIVEDLRRRSLLCSMDAKEERPELRKFRADPLKAVREDRGKYVVAVLTIIRAFMLSGDRQAEPINGYARYCAMIRDPLIWLGCDDPCATMETIREQDTTVGTKKQIARHWKAIFGNEPKTAPQVVTEASRRTL